jgi:phosphoglycolate phosphatase-like HAD superfamily hydrolase
MNSYREIRGTGIYVREGLQSSTFRIDSLAFDCDGVLIDARESYDVTILETTRRLLSECLGFTPSLREEGRDLIHLLRSTGRFNNDWDSTYALVMLTALVRGCGQSTEGELVKKLKLCVAGLSDIKEGIGHEVVDKFLDTRLNKIKNNKIIHRLRRSLGYPGNPPYSKLATLFDELFCGSELFRRVYGERPRYYDGEGYITKDRLLVNQDTLSQLSKVMNNKLSIFTGRPRILAEYTLGPLLDYFSRESSIFVGDMNSIRNKGERLRFSAYRKPSGVAFLYMMERLGASQLLYVGDSAEDLLSVMEAKKRGRNVLFAGLYSCAANVESQINLFEALNADIILPSVNQLPNFISWMIKNEKLPA